MNPIAMNPRICDMSSLSLVPVRIWAEQQLCQQKKESEKEKKKKKVTHHVLPRPKMETEGNDIICWHYVKTRYDPGG